MVLAAFHFVKSVLQKKKNRVVFYLCVLLLEQLQLSCWSLIEDVTC